jgi:hypothetical protein
LSAKTRYKKGIAINTNFMHFKPKLLYNMPIETFLYENTRYEVITANKAFEPAYRKQLCELIKQKYGLKVKRENMLSALQDVFNFYESEIELQIKKVKDISFFLFAYFLHEQTAQISYLTQDGYDFPVEQGYFVIYRRVLKIILQESCNIDIEVSKKEPDLRWMQDNVPIFEKIIYLGHFLFDTVQSIAEEKFTGGSVDILVENDLITFANTKEWDKFIYSLSYHFFEDGRNSIIDVNLQDDFNKRIKTELGIDLKEIEGILAYLNKLLQNKNPPMLCTLEEFIDLLKKNSTSDDIVPFINGLILNRDNVTTIKMAATSPYTGKRIIHKPILTFNLDGTPCILTEQYTFSEALNTFFQNGITLGKIPSEWEHIQFMKKICKDYKAHHKNILEDPVEQSLKKNQINYQRNVKTLFAADGNHLSINDTPGEIDFIFLLNNKIYIADCKNLTKRYEMHGYYQDINTPTLYALNGEFKTYTFHRFNLLLTGDDFFNSYMEWPEGIGTHIIRWPFINNLKKVTAKTL